MTNGNGAKRLRTSAGRHTLAVFSGLIGALGLILCASLARAAEPVYTGSVEPCLSAHGQRDLYHEGLIATGWQDLPEDQRPAALAMLADAYLPITGDVDGTWDAHMAHRAAARAFWTDLAQNRILMVREGFVLLLAGFRDDTGEMRVECWTAGPESSATDNFFALLGQIWQGDGTVMTQVNLPATAERPAIELFVSRMVPPVPPDPPLAATDGLRTRITFRQDEAP